MKAKSIFAATLLVAGAAFADSTTVETDYVLGVLPLTVGKETIINIPWVEAGSDSDATTIAVTNIVKTANLEPGDQLYYYDTAKSEYQVWQVNESTNAWVGTTVSSASGATVSSTQDTTLTRGGALILNREKSAETTVYVIGQVPEAASTIRIAKGYNLFAPPAVSGTTRLDNLIGDKAAAGDKLILDTYKRFTYDGDNWTKPTYNASTYEWDTEDATAEDLTVSAGKGLFYYRASNTYFDLEFSK